MKKLAVILLALSLVRVGVAYADTTTAQSDTFAAGQTSSVTNANQVLYFYKGADGQDGQDGADGQDGQDGLNGVDGADGVNVATTSFTGERGGCTNGGVQVNAVDNVTYICNGSTGTGVISVLFSGSRGTCTNGGVQLTDSTGAVTYACNGSNGANGANGTNGTNGNNGTGGSGGSGSGTTTAGQGVLSISSCESDTAITLNPVRLFDGEDFHFNQIQMGDATSTLGDIEATCAGKPVYFYLTIASGRSLISSSYSAGEILKCSATLPAANQWPGGSPWQFSFLSSANWLALSTPASHELRLRCYRAGGTGAEIQLSSVNTADYTNTIGFEIGQ